MKIVFVAWRDTSHPRAGGSEQLVDRLAAGLHDRGHDVTLLAGDPVTGHSYGITGIGGRFGQYFRAPVAYLQDHRDADLVVDVANGMAYYVPLWRRGPSVCLVNHIHTEQWEQWFGPVLAGVGRTLERRGMPGVYRSRLFCAVSGSTASELVTLGVRRDQIRVVHNGVDLPAADELPGSPPTPLFVSLGRLVPHKRYDLMLRAWRQVHERTGGRLVVVGSGPEHDALEAMAVPGVELRGWVDDDERDELLAQAWALVHPAQVEGWGLVVMEAAARSTATIGFDVPGVRDSVVDGETGVLVRTEAELVDRWADLAQEPSTLRRLGERARQRARQYSWDRTVDEFETLAKEAVARPPRRIRDDRLVTRPDDVAADWRPATTDRLMARAGRFLEKRNAATGADPLSRRHILRLFLNEKHDPEPFYQGLADRSVAEFPHSVAGQRVLDLGCGHGHYARALDRAGATVVPVDLDRESLGADPTSIPRVMVADGLRLPFRAATFDGVMCSNLLEHTPTPERIFTDIARVLRPGGWAWVSWTNWYSPWGGHEIVPLHLLGPRLGLATYRRLFGEPRKNVPFEQLWPTYIGRMLEMVGDQDDLELVDAVPRYYQNQRWILKVPGLREVATWNCLIMLERR